ncbi:MAG: hypothetical protein LLG21_05115, partial [Euryarchaeota archaeon]|nr:hypothetical protein [Euryarchaeota archaeon]
CSCHSFGIEGNVYELALRKRLEALAAPGCGSGIGRAVDGPLYFLYYHHLRYIFDHIFDLPLVTPQGPSGPITLMDGRGNSPSAPIGHAGCPITFL